MALLQGKYFEGCDCGVKNDIIPYKKKKKKKIQTPERKDKTTTHSLTIVYADLGLKEGILFIVVAFNSALLPSK